MASLPKHFVTPEEYLAIERNAEIKSEYMDGVMYAMAGGSERHNVVVANLIMSIGPQLKGRQCKVYPSDLKVSVPNSSKFFYPDVSVVCGETAFKDDRKDVILNPVVIAEVLSDSTAAFDRGKKFISYQQIRSLQEIVFVAQDDILIEKYSRQSDDSWVYTKIDDRDGLLSLHSIDCNVTLMDIYDKAN